MSEHNEKDIPVIPKHQAQADMMHLSRIIRWLVVAIIFGFVCMVIQACIFVYNYTSRTERWLGTYATLVNRIYITEVADEKEEAGIIQQHSLP